MFIAFKISVIIQPAALWGATAETLHPTHVVQASNCLMLSNAAA